MTLSINGEFLLRDLQGSGYQVASHGWVGHHLLEGFSLVSLKRPVMLQIPIGFPENDCRDWDFFSLG